MAAFAKVLETTLICQAVIRMHHVTRVLVKVVVVSNCRGAYMLLHSRCSGHEMDETLVPETSAEISCLV